LLKEHLLTFPSISITQKCQILSCDTLVANERCPPFIRLFPMQRPQVLSTNKPQINHWCSIKLVQPKACSKIIKFRDTNVQNSRDLQCTFRVSSWFTTCTITETAWRGSWSVKSPRLHLRSSGTSAFLLSPCDGVQVGSCILAYKKKNKVKAIHHYSTVFISITTSIDIRQLLYLNDMSISKRN
jgi:hypothetical protein